MMQRACRLWPLLLVLPAVTLALWPDWNQHLFLFLHQSARRLPGAFWRLASVFGDWKTVIALLLPLAWRQPQRLPALIAGSFLAILLAILLKAFFAVPRPPLVLPAGTVQLLDALPRNGSFPSGHAMASALLATAWSADPKAGRWSTALLIVAAALVGWSRLAIGVHWPLDVLAGALLGWGVMRLALHHAWPQGWPARVTERLLLVLSGLLLLVMVFAAVRGWPKHHEEYEVRQAIGTGVALLGLLRFRR
ncbi:phosphatase PAP2 family protein [Pseudogulbenkiania ferrooxidans]|uniref:Phosphoesterase PA-phosphatase related n=1 Tax=Pseudogulbenkiania ferrooxidans 2002 TaxID=279714 RepID=B9Z1L6_9NEIS|nr:phosphatase PAP2 family protein [Pseudogulbenkiania ferrooxidans]EEG09311.1 phosphoesterase PA-phosphatase related [Pseudogulbenkiania ferrooxidans 2002]